MVNVKINDSNPSETPFVGGVLGPEGRVVQDAVSVRRCSQRSQRCTGVVPRGTHGAEGVLRFTRDYRVHRRLSKQ